MPTSSAPTHSRAAAAAAIGRRFAFALLLVLAAVQYAWNAWAVSPLTGYDGAGHAAYVLTIVKEGRLPHPFAGWSTFHPPLYYLIGALVWHALEPLGPRAIVVGLRAISAISILVAGFVAYHLAWRSGVSRGVAWTASALVLFIPCAQMAAAMEGNEALGTGLAALALPFILELQRNPSQPRSAACAGLFCGLALATKYTGLFVAAGCAIPFLRRLDRRGVRALLVCAGLLGGLGAPAYLRNLVLTGSPIPMTRKLEPIRNAEEAETIRERRVTDYLWVPRDCLLRPSIYYVDPWLHQRGNFSMQSIWCLAFASIWYDAFADRIPLAFHVDGVWIAPTLMLLGLAPTGLMLFGFICAVVEVVRHGLRDRNAPLVAMSLVGLTSFLAFTWRAPTLAAVKGSYLLPLAVPSAIFFSLGAQRLGRWRTILVQASGATALLAAVVFTTYLVFPPVSQSLVRDIWQPIDPQFPRGHLRETVDRLLAE
jgi:hypothetical protein